MWLAVAIVCWEWRETLTQTDKRGRALDKRGRELELWFPPACVCVCVVVCVFSARAVGCEVVEVSFLDSVVSSYSFLVFMC